MMRRIGWTLRGGVAALTLSSLALRIAVSIGNYPEAAFQFGSVSPAASASLASAGRDFEPLLRMMAAR